MISKNNPFLFGFSGRAGNLVVKNYSGKMVISNVADMSNRVLTDKQKELNKLMKKANKLAQMVIATPELKEEACRTLNVPPNRAYRTYVKEYIKAGGRDKILPSLRDRSFASPGDPADHIETNHDVMNGKPVFKGTAITVEEVLDRMSKGASIPEVLARYPELTMQDIMASFAFAAKLASI